MTGSPAIFLPRISGSDMFWSSNAWLPISSDRLTDLALGIGQLDADHAAARDGRDARRQRRHVARDVVGKLDHPAGLDAARRFELVHRHHRTGPDLDDVAADVEILEHAFRAGARCARARRGRSAACPSRARARAGRASAAGSCRRAPGSAARRGLRALRAAGAARRPAAARQPRRSGRERGGAAGSARSSRDLGRARRGPALARLAPEQAAEPALSPRLKPKREIAERRPARPNSSSKPSAATGPAIDGLRIRPTPHRRRAPRRGRALRPSRRAGPTRPNRWSGRARRRAGPRRPPRAAARGRSGPAGSSRIIRSPAMAMTGRNSTAPMPNSSSKRVARISAGASEPVGRRTAGGGAQRRIGRVVASRARPRRQR